jgi:hypothetical protein
MAYPYARGATMARRLRRFVGGCYGFILDVAAIVIIARKQAADEKIGGDEL